MEGEVCQFGKFGFCKFQARGCRKKHFIEVCDSLSKCNDTKICNKRHPKLCIRVHSGTGCRFNDECAYSHKDSKEVEEKNEMKETLDILQKKVQELTSKVASLEADKGEQLQKVVKAMSRKVLGLESQLKEMRKGSLKDGEVKEPVLLVVIEEKEMGAEQNTLDINCPINKRPSENNDKKVFTSTPKKEKVKKADKREKMFSCTHCGYECKKETFLNKHMVAKHNELTKKKNMKEDLGVSNIEIQESDEVKLIKRTENVETTDNGEINKSYVFSESNFFDEFL